MLCSACSSCTAAYLGNKPRIYQYEAGLLFFFWMRGEQSSFLNLCVANCNTVLPGRFTLRSSSSCHKAQRSYPMVMKSLVPRKFFLCFPAYR